MVYVKNGEDFSMILHFASLQPKLLLCHTNFDINFEFEKIWY